MGRGTGDMGKNTNRQRHNDSSEAANFRNLQTNEHEQDPAVQLSEN